MNNTGLTLRTLHLLIVLCGQKNPFLIVSLGMRPQLKTQSKYYYAILSD